MRHLIPRGHIALWVGVCLSLAGCSLIRLSVQSARLSMSAILTGRIASAISCQGPVVVVAWKERKGRWEVSRVRLLDEPGEFELIVPNGKYRLTAFGDANGNLVRDPGEPSGSYAGFGSFAAPGGVVSSLDFSLLKTDAEPLHPLAPLTYGRAGAPHRNETGAIVTLDEEVFSEKVGNWGY